MWSPSQHTPRKENCLQLWQWSDSGDDPRCLHRLPCRPDVNCLSYVSLDVLAAATSDGDVTLYRHVSERLEPGRRWDRLHRTKSVQFTPHGVSLGPTSPHKKPPADAAQTSWLTLDASKRYLDVLSLLPAGPLPVNSLDVSEDRLVCGGDNEVIHCVSQLTV
ncbi:hypothetical protein FJT64_015297 [Amphibalanus amphitrite]|uniref:Uncharacterized protein n=1 Tax=Amphibalanus amphitrite TaxID=1232801 RepID=A0A6A4X4U5_AMPAM|nr:hypothetical protein FJT64_015297 [Amphibalanus amphitrite]